MRAAHIVAVNTSLNMESTKIYKDISVKMKNVEKPFQILHFLYGNT